jgi:biopolymer transport protein ExbB/TolQ
VVILSVTLPDGLAKVLLDRGGPTFPYSVQNLMWLIFSIGFGELLLRLLAARVEGKELDQRYLPEDDSTVLVKQALPAIYKKVSLAEKGDERFLPSLIKRIITVFQTTNSVENASAVLNSSIELRNHDLELNYSMIRYVMWVIPTLGFIGTVVGIALALSFAGEPGRSQDPELLTELTQRLAVAFNTTLLALIMAAILVLLMHIIQSMEERIITRCGHYCLDNLVNRLYKTEP